MTWLAAHLVALRQRIAGPRFHPGQTVANVFSAHRRETLRAYLGPYVGGAPDGDGGWVCEERWTTQSGIELAVGVHWTLVTAA